MIEWVVILDNEDNDDFHLLENFCFLRVDNQGIFFAKEEIVQRFFANYTDRISINLAFW